MFYFAIKKKNYSRIECAYISLCDWSTITRITSSTESVARLSCGSVSLLFFAQSPHRLPVILNFVRIDYCGNVGFHSYTLICFLFFFQNGLYFNNHLQFIIIILTSVCQMGFILIMQLFLLMNILSFVHNFRETITTRNSTFYMRHYCFLLASNLSLVYNFS